MLHSRSLLIYPVLYIVVGRDNLEFGNEHKHSNKPSIPLLSLVSLSFLSLEWMGMPFCICWWAFLAFLHISCPCPLTSDTLLSFLFSHPELQRPPIPLPETWSLSWSLVRFVRLSWRPPAEAREHSSFHGLLLQERWQQVSATKKFSLTHHVFKCRLWGDGGRRSWAGFWRPWETSALCLSLVI